jgi:translation initiation factor 3 subunit D
MVPYTRISLTHNLLLLPVLCPPYPLPHLQTSKPRDLATQMSLNPDHCWAIVRALVDMLMRQPEGKYLLVKDPNKDLLRLYAVPEDAFETNYVEEPLADADEVPADAAPSAAADEAGDE